MRILMTGSSGFIGTHLTKALTEAGHRVYGADIVRPPKTSEMNDLYHHMTTDVANPGELDAAVDECGPQYIVHLAAQVGREFGEEDARRTIEWNAVSNTMVAYAARPHNIPVLYTSTSEVYGDRGAEVCTELTPLTKLPHNLYGLTKRWGEDVLGLYLPFHLLTIARLSMPYGPGAPPGRGRRAMDNFLWHAHHKRKITVHKGAERSWCHVSDTVAALTQLIEEARVGTWNVGRDDQTESLYDTALRACTLAGLDKEPAAQLIEFVPPPPMQTVVKRLDTAKIRSIGWRPKVDLEQGMADLYEWIKCFDAEGVYQVPSAAKAA